MKSMNIVVDGQDMQATVSHEHNVVVLFAHDVQGIGHIFQNNLTNPERDVEDAITELVFSKYGNVEWDFK